MSHVINLAAQTILSHFKAEATELEAVMADSNSWEYESDLSPGTVLKKVRRVVSKIRASTKLYDALHAEGMIENLKVLRPILDMRVRYTTIS
jgi:hypothetical protein